jgi:MYXO-CTERM domain-containing protein
MIRLSWLLALGLILVPTTALAVDADGDGEDSVDTGGVDCNDLDASVHTEAEEVCNGRDDNCDGDIDEGFDADADGYSTCGGDCDDADEALNPGAAEVCDDADNDCDGEVDEGFDGDADGYKACGDTADCNDSDAAVFPGGTEVCNGRDDNCDGVVDEELDCGGGTVDGDAVAAGEKDVAGGCGCRADAATATPSLMALAFGALLLIRRRV